MRPRILCVVVMSAAALGYTGCSGPEKVDPPPPGGTLRFVNNASLMVNLYVSPSTSSDWGAVRNTSPIAAYGGTFDLALDSNTYDAMAVTVGGSSTYYAYGMGWSLAAGQTYPLTANNGSFTGSFQVNNGSAYLINGVYLKLSTDSAWSGNQLSSPLSIGESRQIVNVPAGTWDLRCSYSNGGTSTGTYSLDSLSMWIVTCS